MFQGLKSENPCYRDLNSKLQETEDKKTWIFDIFFTQNMGFFIGARLGFGQNLGRAESQTGLVTSGGPTYKP